jgi:hypothetical protein
MYALNGRPMLPSFFSHVENGAVGVLDVVVELHDRFCPVEFLPDVVVPSWLACDEVDQGLGSFAGALASGLEGIVAKDAKALCRGAACDFPLDQEQELRAAGKNRVSPALLIEGIDLIIGLALIETTTQESSATSTPWR